MPWVFTWEKNEGDIAPATRSCFPTSCRNSAKAVSTKPKHAYSQLRTHSVHSLRATERLSRGCPWVRPLAHCQDRTWRMPDGTQRGSAKNQTPEELPVGRPKHQQVVWLDRKSTRLNSSHLGSSYAVF